MKHLVEFNFGIEYACDQEVRILNDEELEQVKLNIGKEIYLGEINGKHSDVQGKFEDGDYTVLKSYEDNDPFVKEFCKMFPNGIGIEMYYYIVND